MPDILIQGGGDAEAAAKAMRAAIREIFETDPIQSVRGGDRPSTRGLVEAFTLVLTIPPGIFYAGKLISDLHLGDRVRRLTGKAVEAKPTGAQILIDPGDGKPIPLHQANHEKIREALAALEQQHKKD